MNRMMKLAILVVAAGGVFGSVGCMGRRPSAQDRYAGVVDPSWPERYNYQARQETVAPFAAHVNNGAVLDQSLFNYHFEQGSDKLTAGGLEKLDYLTRRRPFPESKVYLATARDLSYDVTAPEKLIATRTELDLKRAAAIQKYVTASTGQRNITFDVQVLDIPDVSQNASGPATAVRGYTTRFQSGLQGGSSGLSGAGGGAAPGGASAGGTTTGTPSGGGGASGSR